MFIPPPSGSGSALPCSFLLRSVGCVWGSRLGQGSRSGLSNEAEEEGFVHSLRGSAHSAQKTSTNHPAAWASAVSTCVSCSFCTWPRDPGDLNYSASEEALAGVEQCVSVHNVHSLYLPADASVNNMAETSTSAGRSLVVENFHHAPTATPRHL